METVAIDDVEPDTYDPENRTHDRRVLTGPLNASDVAVNHYVLDPGERFSGAVHAHDDQEELFLVVDGEATFETRNGEVVVSADEAIRFAPGEFQSGRNDGDEPVVAFALGAPRDSEAVRIASVPGVGDVECPDCGRGDMTASADGGLVCPDCGAELTLE